MLPNRPPEGENKMNGRTALTAALLVCACTVARASEEPPVTFTRDLQVDVCVNQIGYTPGAHKRCVVLADNGGQFQVIALPAHTVSLTGELHVTQGDFGKFGVGDFMRRDRAGSLLHPAQANVARIRFASPRVSTTTPCR